MEEKVLQGLNDIGYNGPLLDKTKFYESLEIGPKDVDYTKLVKFITSELKILYNIDEEVNAIDVPEDSVAFIMEVTSFLKELNCPYSCLSQGHISERLQNISDRVLLLDYLLSELMGARILEEIKPNKEIELKLRESDEAANMRKILITLGFPKPPANINVESLFKKLVPSVQSIVQKAAAAAGGSADNDLLGEPAFKGFLSEQQWDSLNRLQTDLNHEYTIRREMLITRLDVTIQSFQWSDRTKGADDLFEKLYTEKRKHLKSESNVNIADLLAAKRDIAIIEKTSSSSVRKNTKSKLNKIIIGQVPDRGGRTSEQAPPPPEMPSWQQRQAPSSARGGGGGQQYSRGGGGGGNNRNFDSAGSYRNNNDRRGSFDNNNRGGNNSYEQNNKRVKTYDSFQSNQRTTYADQYVQETQHNWQQQQQQQQYSGGDRGGRGGGGRGRGRGRGHSDYNRGGGRNNYY